jgi:hypothetical protein
MALSEVTSPPRHSAQCGISPDHTYLMDPRVTPEMTHRCEKM